MTTGYVHYCTPVKSNLANGQNPLGVQNCAMSDQLQNATRALVLRMLEATGLQPAQLAKRAGLTPSTLTRFLNKQDVKHTLSAPTLAKLSEASGVPIPSELLTGAKVAPQPVPAPADLPALRREQGARLRRLRERAGRVEAVASRAGVTADEWIAMEDGAPIDALALALFCLAANFPADYVISGSFGGMPRELARQLLLEELEEEREAARKARSGLSEPDCTSGQRSTPDTATPLRPAS